MFVTGITRRVDMPDGEWVEIRKLSGKQLKRASKAAVQDAADTAKSFGGDVMAAIRQGKDSDEVKDKLADPLNTYDRWEVLNAGIADWSYTALKVNSRSIDDMDEASSEFLAREILAFSLPDRTEDEQKNA